MSVHIKGLLAGIGLLAIIWASLWQNRQHWSRSDVRLVILGTLMLIGGEALHPRQVLWHGSQFIAFALLCCSGAIVAVIPLFRRLRLVRTPVSDTRIISKCKTWSLVLAGFVIAYMFSFIVVVAAFPNLMVPAGYFVGGLGTAELITIAGPVMIGMWFAVMRKRPFPKRLFERNSVVATYVAICISALYVPLIMHVRFLTASGFHPLPGVIAAYCVVIASAMLTGLVVGCCYWFALWGLAAGV